MGLLIDIDLFYLFPVALLYGYREWWIPIVAILD